MADESLIDEERVVLDWLNELEEAGNDRERDAATERFLQVVFGTRGQKRQVRFVSALGSVCRILLYRLASDNGATADPATVRRRSREILHEIRGTLPR
jgi:hypothetical protein